MYIAARPTRVGDLLISMRWFMLGAKRMSAKIRETVESSRVWQVGEEEGLAQCKNVAPPGVKHDVGLAVPSIGQQ